MKLDIARAIFLILLAIGILILKQSTLVICIAAALLFVAAMPFLQNKPKRRNK